MDEIVLRGMAKWPNVPAVYGWLSLDRRGNWLIKDERIANPGVTAFIGRNYGRDEEGRWFFQNGPQRVFVALEYAPIVYRVLTPGHGALALETHFGKPVSDIRGAWVDDSGTVALETEHGIGSVHDSDLDQFLSAFTDARGGAIDDDTLEALLERLAHGEAVELYLKFRDRSIKVEPIRSDEMPRRFDYQPRPSPPPGSAECG